MVKLNKKQIYLGNIKNLPEIKLSHSYNTRIGSPRGHVYKINIVGYTYFKVHIKRKNQCFIKYFKLKREAKAYVETLRMSKILISGRL